MSFLDWMIFVMLVAIMVLFGVDVWMALAVVSGVHVLLYALSR